MARKQNPKARNQLKRRARPAGHATLVDSDRLCQRAGKARKIESDQPDVLNNLAATLQAVGRFEEAEVIVNELLTKFPDYFFSKIISPRPTWFVDNLLSG